MSSPSINNSSYPYVLVSKDFRTSKIEVSLFLIIYSGFAIREQLSKFKYSILLYYLAKLYKIGIIIYGFPEKSNYLRFAHLISNNSFLPL